MHTDDTLLCFLCPACGRPVTALPRMIGRSVRCPACLVSLIVPRGDGTTPQPGEVIPLRPEQPPTSSAK